MTSDDRDLGTVLRDGDRLGLRYERRMAHPPEKVWRALTEAEHLRHWFPCDIVGDRRAGAALTLPFWPGHVEQFEIETPAVHGEVLAWDPPSLFEWRWDTDVVRWELEPVDGGTRLVATTWLGASDVDPADAAGGWHLCLDRLATLLDHGDAGPWSAADPQAASARYVPLVVAALGGSEGSASASR